MGEVEAYKLRWHPQHGSQITINVKGRGWLSPISVSAADLAAFAAIMQEKPVQMSKDGWIQTGPEPVGGKDE